MGRDSDMDSATGVLKAADADLVALEADGALVVVTPRYQGRIFCTLGGRLVHRLDASLLDAPPGGEFKNIGGNSLWPAPEGGCFAFNYPPDGGDWYVQEGIADVPTGIVTSDASSVTVRKDITLVNRAGTSARVEFRRVVRLRVGSPEAAQLPEGVSMLHYETEDILAPQTEHTPDDFLLAAWSLEQFAGGDGVTAFTCVDDTANAINDDYYGGLPKPPEIDGSRVCVPLGGTARFQIGIRVAAAPRLVGAIDPANGWLIIRRTPRQEGRYFNIADNEQPEGPRSAADMYSVFNGGELDFYELEAIAPLHMDGEHVGASRLPSETMIFTGPVEGLREVMEGAT
jgi:hypothetical protein